MLTPAELDARSAELERLAKRDAELNRQVTAIVGDFVGSRGTADYRRYLLRRHAARATLTA